MIAFARGRHRAVVRVAPGVGGDWRMPGVRSRADRMALRSVNAGVDWRRSRRWRDAGGRDARVGWADDVERALRFPAFWVFALASSVYGLVASGIGLLNESILVERGFTPDIYYRALAVTAITGLLGNFTAALAGRTSLRSILVTALLVLAAGLAALAHVSTAAHVMAQAVAMGVAGGFIVVVLLFSFWGRAYGRAHLGRIQAAAQNHDRAGIGGRPAVSRDVESSHGLLRGGVLRARGRRAHPRRGGCRRIGASRGARNRMKLLVFGASGKTGREVVRQALARRYMVTAFVRQTARLPIAHANLRLVAGRRSSNPEAIARVVAGQTAVISTLGGGQPMTHDQVVIEGVRAIARAAEQASVERLLYLSFIGVHDSRDAAGFVLSRLATTLLRHEVADHEVKEAAITASFVDWTIVRPPKLTNGRLTAAFRWEKTSGPARRSR